MKRIAVIPARGGSRRIPRKNIRAFHGRPIIGYSIMAALASQLFDYVFVSTDDQEIAGIAKRLGAYIHLRDEIMAGNDVGTRAVMRRVVEELGLKDDDIACCIYATAPLMSIEDLAQGAEMMENCDVSHAISIGYPPLQDAAQFYWSEVRALREDVEYFDVDTAVIHVSADRVCDINTEDDWKMAEQMYEALQHGSLAWTTRRTL